MTETLSPKQFRLLKKLQLKGRISISVSNQNPDYQRLISLGYAKYNLTNEISSNGLLQHALSITLEGESYLGLCSKYNSRWRITTVISVLAIMKSYGIGIDDIVIWCMRQLSQ